MKERVEIRGVRTYWKESRNELYSAPVHKTVEVTVPLKLVFLKIYLIFASISAVVCLAIAAILSEYSNTASLVPVFGFIGVAFVASLLLWFNYYIQVEYLAVDDENSWNKELQDERAELLQQANEWREAHPFEEQCRKALEKNPNEIAKLIKMMCEEKDGRD